MDYFFLKIFHFLIFLKKERDDAKWSTLLFTSLYATSFVVLVFCVIGLEYENLFSSIIKQNPLAFTLIVGVICPVLLGLRYYRKGSIELIEKSWTEKNNGGKKIINLLIYLSLVFLPILNFIFFRLYVIGQLKWW